MLYREKVRKYKSLIVFLFRITGMSYDTLQIISLMKEQHKGIRKMIHR